MNKIIICIFIFVNISLAQKTIKYNESLSISPETDLKEMYTFSETSKNKNSKKELIYRLDQIMYHPDRILKEEKRSFDLLNNLGSNISFGGFYESYAVLNFTPQLYIKPSEFISVYANHYLNIFIPLSRAKEVSESIFINSISILALDNAADLLFRNENWIAEIAEFALKNCILNFILKPELGDNSAVNDSILQFDNFYYSINIFF